MFWKILFALASLADKIIDKFVPSRKEATTQKYLDLKKKLRKRKSSRAEALKN